MSNVNLIDLKDFKPMLAASATSSDIERFKFPLMVSPKLDGIRAIVINSVVMSRSLKPIRNKRVQEMFGKPEFNGLDGELIVGDPRDPNCFNNSTSVMGEETRDDVKDLPIRFYVFDITPMVLNDTAMNRFGQLVRMHTSQMLGSGTGDEDGDVIVVPQVIANSLDELLEYEKEFLRVGYEGAMVKDPEGLYKCGRSTLKQRLLTKVKRFQDAEAVVVGYEEKLTNVGEREITELGYSKTSSKKADFIPAGTLGALKVRDLETGIEFSIGSGYDDATRDALWESKDQLEGKIVKYKHFSVGVKEAPRFPTFLGFRDLDDM